jgi:hypothetical protein
VNQIEVYFLLFQVSNKSLLSNYSAFPEFGESPSAYISVC